jgi:hypothetical protein
MICEEEGGKEKYAFTHSLRNLQSYIAFSCNKNSIYMKDSSSLQMEP